MVRVAIRTRHVAAAVLLGGCCAGAHSTARADGVEVYAAGSLRLVVAELAEESAATLATAVEKGQAIIARCGLVPIAGSQAAAP